MKKFLSILLAVMMVLSTVSFAAPSAVVVDDSAFVPEDDAILTSEEDSTATLAEDASTYGTLLFDLDFESDSYPASGVVSKIGPVKAYTTKTLNIPSAFGDNPSEWLRVDTVNDIEGDYEQINGSNVYTVEVINDNIKYPYFNIKHITSSWGQAKMPDGYYTIVGDFAKDAANQSTGVVQARIPNGGGKAVGTSPALTTTMTEYTTTVALITDENGTAFYGNGTKHADIITDASGVFGVGVYFGSSQIGDKYYVDNFKVYYKPLTVKANIDVGTNHLAKGGKYDVSTDGVTPAELGKLVSNTNYSAYVSGATVGDKTYTANEKIYFAEDSDVTLTWDTIASKWYDNKYGTMIFDITMDENTSTSSDDLVTAGKTPITNYVHPNVASFSDADFSSANKYFMRATNFTSAEVVSENGNNVLKMMNPTSARCGFSVETWESTHSFVNKEDVILTLVYDVKEDASNGSLINVTDRFIYNNSGESTGTENKPTATLGQWRTNVTTFTPSQLDSGKKMTNVKSIISITYGGSATQTSHTYYYDNVRLYFKPVSANVTLTSNDSNVVVPKDAVKVSTSGVLCSELVKDVKIPDDYIISGVKIGATTYTLSDTVYVAQDEKAEVVAKKDTEYASKWIDSSKGTLLFDVNFDKDNDGNAVSVQGFNKTTSDDESSRYISKFGSINPKISNYSNTIGKLILAANSFASSEIVNDANLSSNVLVATATGSNRYPLFTLDVAYSLRANDDFLKDQSGVFTLEHIWKDETGLTPTYRFNGRNENNEYNAGGDVDWGTGANTTTEDLGNGYTKYTTYFTKPESDSIHFDYLKIHVNGTPAAGNKTYIDGIKLYYKPAKVNVTVKGGKNTSFKDEVLSVSTAGTKASDIISKISDLEYGKVTGLMVNGKRVGPNDSINLVSDTTVTALWTKWNVIEGYDFLEFNTDMTASQLLENRTNNATFAWGSYGNKSDTGVAGKDDPSSQGAIYSAVSAKDGSFKFTLPETFEHTATDGTRFTFKTPGLKAGQVKGFLIKLRYTNIPDFEELYDVCEEYGCYENGLISSDDMHSHNFVNQNAAGEDEHSGTFTTLGQNWAEFNLHFSTGSEWSGAKYAVKNTDLVEGKWVTAYVDIENTVSDFANRGAMDYFYLAPIPNMWNGMTLEVDYIRLIGETVEDHAPESLADNTSIRVSTPSGVRFMASMTTEEQAKATSYGWIVTRKTLIDAASLTNDTFTIENADAKSLNYRKGYAYGNGVTTPIIYNEDDTSVYFTAVLYGIPENMYNDVLVARPFTVVDGTTYYGDAVSATVNEIATKIAEGGYAGLTEAQKTYIKNIYDNINA